MPLYYTSRPAQKPAVLRGNSLSSIIDVRGGAEFLPLATSSKYRWQKRNVECMEVNGNFLLLSQWFELCLHAQMRKSDENGDFEAV